MAINWKNRAKKFEAEAQSKHAQFIHLAFNFEKEKALHRRTNEQANDLDLKLQRARTLLYGAAENLAGHGQHASADALQASANDLYVIPRTAAPAMAKGIAQDEQH